MQAVETNLMALPMVHACVVLVMGEEGQNKFLVAYIVPEGLYIFVETIKLTSAYECFNLYKVLK